MITVRRLPHNGALELSAMVRDTAGWGVWLEHTTYYGYNKTEAKRRFREHLIEKHYVLVNDQVMEVTTMNTTEKLWHTDSQFLNTEIEYVFERLNEVGFSDKAERNYWQGRLDSLASIERARKQGVM